MEKNPNPMSNLKEAAETYAESEKSIFSIRPVEEAFIFGAIHQHNVTIEKCVELIDFYFNDMNCDDLIQAIKQLQP